MYAGVTLDAAGNLYMTSEVNSGYAETFNGLWEIPNVCGPAKVTGANLNTCMEDGNIELLAPIHRQPTVGNRFAGLHLVHSLSSSFAPPGGRQTDVYSIGVFAPGVLNLNYPARGSFADRGQRGRQGYCT